MTVPGSDGFSLGSRAGGRCLPDPLVARRGIMLMVPGAMDAHLDSPLFWGSLAVALAIAWVIAFPVNRWLIARGRGHAVVHGRH